MIITGGLQRLSRRDRRVRSPATRRLRWSPSAARPTTSRARWPGAYVVLRAGESMPPRARSSSTAALITQACKPATVGAVRGRPPEDVDGQGPCAASCASSTDSYRRSGARCTTRMLGEIQAEALALGCDTPSCRSAGLHPTRPTGGHRRGLPSRVGSRHGAGGTGSGSPSGARCLLHRDDSQPEMTDHARDRPPCGWTEPRRSTRGCRSPGRAPRPISPTTAADLHPSNGTNQSSLRSSRRIDLAGRRLGRSPTKRTDRGSLYAARCARQ